MLSLFPELLNYSALAPVLLRLALGGTFLLYGLSELIRPHYLPPVLARIIGVWEALIGSFIIIGLFTQVVSLLAILELLGYLAIRLKNKERMPIPVDYLLVMLAIAISLLLLGPGLWAIDLPL